MISPHIVVVASEPTTLHPLSAMLAGMSYPAEEFSLGAEAVAKYTAIPCRISCSSRSGKATESGCTHYSKCVLCGRS
jgi:hypothetical protein